MTSLFDYQWENLPCEYIELNGDRINEFKNFTNISPEWFTGKMCMDAGCGSGRYTYAMMALGANVWSYDQSGAAVDKCCRINPFTFKASILDFKDTFQFDFVLAWGVLHHMPDPKAGFDRLVGQLKPGGMMHLYLYTETSQPQYSEKRKKFKNLATDDEKLEYVKWLVKTEGGNEHSWWDALVPEFNWGLNVPTVREWFEGARFKDIRFITEVDINVNAIKL